MKKWETLRCHQSHGTGWKIWTIEITDFPSDFNLHLWMIVPFQPGDFPMNKLYSDSGDFPLPAMFDDTGKLIPVADEHRDYQKNLENL